MLGIQYIWRARRRDDCRSAGTHTGGGLPMIGNCARGQLDSCLYPGLAYLSRHPSASQIPRKVLCVRGSVLGPRMLSIHIPGRRMERLSTLRCGRQPTECRASVAFTHHRMCRQGRFPTTALPTINAMMPPRQNFDRNVHKTSVMSWKNCYTASSGARVVESLRASIALRWKSS